VKWRFLKTTSLGNTLNFYKTTMKIKYHVSCPEFKTIKELQGFWTNQKYKDILDLLDFPDVESIEQNELKDMCYMALTDNEPEESAKIVLEYIFKDKLNDGQISNLSHEIVSEKLWEEYADLSLHEDFYNVTQLLYDAYNGKFPNPNAVRFTVNVKANKAEDLDVFSKDLEASLIRLLAQGMPENTLLKRLFEDQLNGEDFIDAKDIIWQYTQTKNDNEITFTLLSSTYWFLDFKYVDSFEAELSPIPNEA
jgi:hypothetical protein